MPDKIMTQTVLNALGILLDLVCLGLIIYLLINRKTKSKDKDINNKE